MQWEHADLEPVRAFLLEEAAAGRFQPQAHLPP